jgi:phosphinothricin acetyltransferase
MRDHAGAPTATVRPLADDDFPRVCEIYNYAVRHTVATLDTQEKTVAEMRVRLSSHGKRYSVVGVDVDGQLAGYGHLSPFAARGGYLASAEISIYVAPEHWKYGIGMTLCAWVTECAGANGFTTVISFISAGNVAAQKMVTTLGYVYTGVIERVGYKLGQLVDMEIYQRVFHDNLARYDGRPLAAILDRKK